VRKGNPSTARIPFPRYTLKPEQRLLIGEGIRIGMLTARAGQPATPPLTGEAAPKPTY
jgi:hypothetical protein